MSVGVFEVAGWMVSWESSMYDASVGSFACLYALATVHAFALTTHMLAL